MKHVRSESGFTLVELMLAMAFVSALLLAIAMTVIQIGNIYNKGITYKTVNQAGTALSSELQREINSNLSFDLNSTDPVRKVTKAWGGRLCIGQYSYIWNYGKALKDDIASQLNVYTNATPLTPKIHFIKVIDSTASYCSTNNPRVTVDIADAVELLDVGNNNLAIHSFSIKSSANDSSTKQRIYNISFLIGTSDITELTPDTSSCLPPDDIKSDTVYCAVNRFDILARAGNSTTE